LKNQEAELLLDPSSLKPHSEFSGRLQAEMCSAENRKAEPFDPAFLQLTAYAFRYLFNFLLAPANPTRPRHNRIMVAGSGTLAVITGGEYETVGEK